MGTKTITEKQYKELPKDYKGIYEDYQGHAPHLKGNRCIIAMGEKGTTLFIEGAGLVITKG